MKIIWYTVDHDEFMRSYRVVKTTCGQIIVEEKNELYGTVWQGCLDPSICKRVLCEAAVARLEGVPTQ